MKVLGIEQSSASIILHTEAGAIEAGAVIVAAGPWIGDLAPILAPHLKLTREVQLWFKPSRPDLFAPEAFPVFALYDPEDICYGFPDFAGTGVKAASHTPGRPLPHADAARQDGSEQDGALVRRILTRHIPALDCPIVRTETCIYTNTSDGDFIIDRHPDNERIVLASACSGHGFKYAPAIGEILADLALGELPSQDIAPFRLERFYPAH
jgi:sarcosine oxidase